MRISKLSARAGLPVGTVKFYLRTGLLHSGVATSATQALYDDSHLNRLKLVRALLEVGGLSLAGIRRVLDAVELHDEDPAEGMVRVQEALSGAEPSPATVPVDVDTARALVEDLGWHVRADSPHLPMLARALNALESVGLGRSIERFSHYASAASELARQDQELLERTPVEDRALTLATSTVLYDAVLVALRRLAGEGHARPGTVPEPRMAEAL